MPVTNISYKLRQFFLKTGMLYRGGGGEILGLFLTTKWLEFITESRFPVLHKVKKTEIFNIEDLRDLLKHSIHVRIAII